MRLAHAVLAVVVLLLISPMAVRAQSQPGPSVSVPRLINISGVFQPADGQTPGSVEAITLSIYAEPEGGTPLWQETQSIALDATGRYTVLLGATHAEGIPPAVFASGEAQWLSTLFARVGEVEGPRVRVTSVPYALRASDAETLAGRPASAYVLAPSARKRDNRATAAAGAEAPSGATPQASLPGTTMQVAGDIRVGTAGTNGCIMDFDGAGLVGTCASDRRFKRDITPIGQVLGQLTALQPVHYFWRAADFPARHFGDRRAYGLIAQEVEQVLPELVATGTDGFKAVDYSKLPLLTIQAVKELKAENDALKHRVAELERLFTEMLATAARR